MNQRSYNDREKSKIFREQKVLPRQMKLKRQKQINNYIKMATGNVTSFRGFQSHNIKREYYDVKYTKKPVSVK
jgi:hypothetical protein